MTIAYASYFIADFIVLHKLHDKRILEEFKNLKYCQNRKNYNKCEEFKRFRIFCKVVSTIIITTDLIITIIGILLLYYYYFGGYYGNRDGNRCVFFFSFIICITVGVNYYLGRKFLLREPPEYSKNTSRLRCWQITGNIDSLKKQ